MEAGRNDGIAASGEESAQETEIERRKEKVVSVEFIVRREREREERKLDASKSEENDREEKT